MFLSQSAGKMSRGKRPAPAQRGIMRFFHAKRVSIKLQRVTFNTSIVALVTAFILSWLSWQFNRAVIEYSMMRATMRTMTKTKQVRN